MPLKREHLHGLDDGFNRAFELVVTPIVFALIGFGLDRWWGTTPLMTVLLALFAVVGTATKLWIDYDARMKRHEAELAERRHGNAS